MKPKAWSMDENKFIIVDDNNNKVEIDINVFGQDFVKNLFTYKKQAEQKANTPTKGEQARKRDKEKKREASR